MFRRYLPWEYGVRNLLRRPARTSLTLAALTVVVLLVLVVVGFVRGLDASLTVSGDPEAVLVYSLGAEQNVENSAIDAAVPQLITASLQNVQTRYGVPHVSPELYLGTRVGIGESEGNALGLVRGVTSTAPLVRRQVRIVQGHWPQEGEVIVGRLVAAKLGCPAEALAVERRLTFEGRTWTIAGRFEADGGATESEIWCRLPDFQQALKRQDLSLVALLLKPGGKPGQVQLFCQERTDLELQAVRETDYYAALQQHYRPIQHLAWLVVVLISGAGVFAGVNLMYGAVSSRVRELATLQAVGYRRRAILVSIVQEGTLLAIAASLLAAAVAVLLIDGAAVRFTMGAFSLKFDATTLLIGCGAGWLLGILGSIPPAWKAMRLEVAPCLKAV